MLQFISASAPTWEREDHTALTALVVLKEDECILDPSPFHASQGAAGLSGEVFRAVINSGAEIGAYISHVEGALDDLRAAAKSAVDAAAEAYRLTCITGGAGQAMAYQQKLEEAKAYLADASLTAAECPHIFAEVGLTGQTAWEVAQIVVNLYAIWQIKSADIERKRLAAKAAIDVAETAEAINAASMVDWGD